MLSRLLYWMEIGGRYWCLLQSQGGLKLHLQGGRGLFELSVKIKDRLLTPTGSMESVSLEARLVMITILAGTRFVGSFVLKAAASVACLLLCKSECGACQIFLNICAHLPWRFEVQVIFHSFISYESSSLLLLLVSPSSPPPPHHHHHHSHLLGWLISYT